MTRLSRFFILGAMALPLCLHAARPSQPGTPPEANTTPAPIGPAGIITLVAGTGYYGYSGIGGLATKAELVAPQGIAVDSAGDLYISDQYLAVVYKVTKATGILSVYAGTGVGGYSGDGGPALKAELDEPLGLALDAAGDLYIADSRNNVIREVNAKTGIITTVAGNGEGAGAGGADGCGPYTTASGPALSYWLCGPNSVAVDSAGNLYIANPNRYGVYEVNAKTGDIAMVVGHGAYGYSGDGGKAVSADLGPLQAQIFVDGSNNLYIADSGNCAIRKVTAATGIITSLVGKPSTSGFGGTCGLAGDGGPAVKAQIDSVFGGGLAVDASGNVYIADQDNSIVRMISAANKNIYTIAGSYEVDSFGTFGEDGFMGYGGPATQAKLDLPGQIAIDRNGNLFGADPDNAVVFEVEVPSALPTTAPVISPPMPPLVGELTFEGTLKVTITNPVANSTLYYTLDGTLPNTNSAKYTGPIVLNETSAVTAFSVTNATGAAVPNGPTPAKASEAKLGLYAEMPPPPVIEANGKPVNLGVTNFITTETPIQIVTTKAKCVEGLGGSASNLQCVDIGYYSTNGLNPAAGLYQPGVYYYTNSFNLEEGTQTVTAATDLQVLLNLGFLSEVWSLPVTAQFSVSVPAAPAVTTGAASGLAQGFGHMDGSVNPNSAATTYWMVYGESKGTLTSSSTKLTAGAGHSPVAVSVVQSGLKPKTTYYYQLVAENETGTGKGQVMSFTTP